jgi:hypothetical protein
MMTTVLKELIDEGVLYVYIDDIIIYTKDPDVAVHRKIVWRMLKILQKHKLFLKPVKCEFEKEEVELLGVIVGRGKVRMDPKKVEVIQGWPIPRCKKDVQKFLGFCNFYRRFVEHYGDKMRALTSLTGK